MDDHATITRMADIPFPLGWYSFLPDSSWLFPHAYDQLPPIPSPDPAFRFLAPDADTTAPPPTPAREAYRVWLHRQLATVSDAAARLGLTLPAGFTRLMGSPELQECLWSGGCGCTLSNQVVPCPGFDGAYLVCFLRDQQDCLVWCLCLTPDGESCVLAVASEVLDAMPDARRDALLGMLDPDRYPGEEIPTIEEVVAGAGERDASWEVATDGGGICICAHSFAAFIYRFWIESEIQKKLDGYGTTPLTDAERGYWEQFERQQHSGG